MTPLDPQPHDEHRDGPEDRREAERRQGPLDRREPFLKRVKRWLTGEKRGYRDVALIIIAFFVWQAVQGNSDQAKANAATLGRVQASRIEATWASCQKSNEQTAGINGLATAIQGLLLSGAALPGDRPSPLSDPIDPSKWRQLAPGPLSRQLEGQFPDLPTAQERLNRARENADTLEARKVKPRDCDGEVRDLGGDPDTLPQPTPVPTP